jgi:ribosomal protein S18 acetylase RimI-like enzyme
VADPEYRIREFRDADYDALAGVHRRAFPDHPLSPDEMRRFDAFLTGEGRVPHRLAAVRPGSDELVALGELSQLPFNYHPRKYWVNVIVDPLHRRRGIGRALYDRLEREALRREATTLWTSFNADVPADVEFARARGFAEVRRQRQSRITLAGSRPDLLVDRSSELRSLGIEFTTVAAEGANRESVRRECYRLHEVSAEGMPGVGARTPITFEEFLQLEFSGPGFFPEGHFLAKIGGEFVSMTMLEREATRPDVLRVGFT